jgi:hypothetical protein
MSFVTILFSGCLSHKAFKANYYSTDFVQRYLRTLIVNTYIRKNLDQKISNEYKKGIIMNMQNKNKEKLINI